MKLSQATIRYSLYVDSMPADEKQVLDTEQVLHFRFALPPQQRNLFLGREGAQEGAQHRKSAHECVRPFVAAQRS